MVERQNPDLFPSILEIDLKKLNHNFDLMKSMLADDKMMMSVIKADAYGHGAIEIARALKKTDWFGVATIREGIELRNHGIKKPILVFTTPTKYSAKHYKKYDLTATISSINHFSLLPSGTKAHIQFDTGMYRFGFLEDDLEKVLKSFVETDLKINGIFTHLAEASESKHESVFHQVSKFKHIVSHFNQPLLTHIQNSGGTSFYSDLDFDIARIGIALYGYQPGLESIPNLKPIATWKSSVISCKPIKKGTPVSYDFTHHVESDGFICVIPVGYADGLNRGLSNKIGFQINDVNFPQVGRITMDYCMFFSKHRIPVGTEVSIMGNTEESNARTWSNQIQTIPYEVLTSINSRRVKRLYNY